MNGKIEIRLRPEELDQLRRLAARRDLSVAELIRAKLRHGAIPCDRASATRTEHNWRTVPVPPHHLGDI